ncbi:MAG: hypothetical protein K2X53_03480 [Alphaproteobacteria bacterium]|nr:hypothetical protein [Alphaproteobacteria bacterium]
MNRILYLIMVVSVCLMGSVHASRVDSVEDQDGPAQKLLRRAFSNVNMNGLSEKQKVAIRKASALIDKVQDRYEEIDEKGTSYVSLMSTKIGSVVEYWQQLDLKHKISIVAPVVGFAIIGGAYFIVAATQSGDIVEILNVTANFTQGMLS